MEAGGYCCVSTLTHCASGPFFSRLFLQVFQSVYCYRHPAQLPAGMYTLPSAALELSSPAEKILQSLPGPVPTGKAGVQPNCSHQDTVRTEPSWLCSILDKIYSVESWSKQ